MKKNLLTIANHPSGNDPKKWCNRANAQGCEWVSGGKKIQLVNLRHGWKIELEGFTWLQEIAAHERTKTFETLAEAMRVIWAMEAQKGEGEKELWMEW